MNPTAEKLQQALISLGIAKGDILLVHSAFRPLKIFFSNAEEIIEMLEDLIGPEGTLLMPALSYLHVTEAEPVFDEVKTPGNCGYICETFRKQSGVIRSLHPTHSVCGRGKYAREILSGHELDHTPCGAQSAFAKLPKYNGKILMLGCGLAPNTTMHAIEERHKPTYLLKPNPIAYKIHSKEKGYFIMNSYPHDFKGVGQNYPRISEILTQKTLNHVKVKDITLDLIDSKELFKKASEALEKDLFFFVKPF